jgi:alpha-glutamyl/putrescinyl thymine pyrophosphorylase clade 1
MEATTDLSRTVPDHDADAAVTITATATKIGAIANPVDRLFAFVHERHAVYLRRAAGEPAPWTTDRIMRDWSFCNIYRELDRTTRWIATQWRGSHADDPDLWFAMVVARFVNWPDTLAEIGYPVPWVPGHFLAVMTARKARGEKVYGDAYMIRADRQHKDKAAYQIEAVFKPLWRARERIRAQPGDRLSQFHRRLESFHGMGGGFMTAQVIADLKYVEPLRSASDWDTYAASGPGSRKGMNLVLGRPADQKWEEVYWGEALNNLRAQTRPMFEAAGMEVPHAQDAQNCLCEFFKYERARLGQGYPKRRFTPKEATP